MKEVFKLLPAYQELSDEDRENVLGLMIEWAKIELDKLNK